MSTPGSHQYPSNNGHGAPYGTGHRTSQDPQPDRPRGYAGTQSTASSSPPITPNLSQSSYGRVTQGTGYDWQDRRSEITSPLTPLTYPGPQGTTSHQQVPSPHAYTSTVEPYTHRTPSTSTQDSSNQFIEQQHSPPRNPRHVHADSQYLSPPYSPGRRGSISPSSQGSLQPQLHPHQPQPQLQPYQSQPHGDWAEQRYPPPHHSSSHAMSPHSQHLDPLLSSVPYHPTQSTYPQPENRGRQNYQQPRPQLQPSPYRSPAPPYPDAQYHSTSPSRAAQPPCRFPQCGLPVIRNNTNELTEYCGEPHMFAAVQQLGIPACIMCRRLPQRIRVESEYCGTACEWAARQRQETARPDYQRFTPPSPPVTGRVPYHRDEGQYERSERSPSTSGRHTYRDFY